MHSLATLAPDIHVLNIMYIATIDPYLKYYLFVHRELWTTVAYIPPLLLVPLSPLLPFPRFLVSKQHLKLSHSLVLYPGVVCRVHAFALHTISSILLADRRIITYATHCLLTHSFTPDVNCLSSTCYQLL